LQENVTKSEVFNFYSAVRKDAQFNKRLLVGID